MVVAAPVTVSGNAISVVGDGWSENAETVVAGGSGTGSSGESTTNGDESIPGGTQVQAPVTAPVTIGGNAISVVGDGETDGASTAVIAGGSGPGRSTTIGDDSVRGGTQVLAPIAAGGNAISVIGDSESTDSTTHVVTGGGSGNPSTSGDDSIGGGTQLVTPITLPTAVGGNAVCLIGDCTTSTSTTTVDPTDPTDPTGPTDPGDPTDPTDPR